jgi:sortase (surface protein transpeptidase)
VARRLSQTATGGFGRQGWLFVAALTAAVCGVVALVFAIGSQQSAPQPPASARGTISVAQVTPPDVTPTSTATDTRTPASSNPNGTRARPKPTTRSLPPSPPVTIDIPAIGVHSTVIALGRSSDGALAVPQPGPDLNKVAWYDGSVTPGQAGPSVLEGHVDSVYGPSVFFRLGAVRLGNHILVTRADGSTAGFTVNAVRSYLTHADFPALQVFGSDLAEPTLRLITCSNFDSSTGHYAGNTVVYAHLTSIHSTPTHAARHHARSRSTS